MQTLLTHLAAGGTLEGTDKRRIIQLTCHQVLARAGDPRAAELLAVAHADLEALAATIGDSALRQRFLNNVPAHREIERVWAAQQSAAAIRGPTSMSPQASSA